MLSLAELGAQGGGGGNARRIVCTTAGAAVRILTELAEHGNHVLPHHRARMLAAVVDWILDDQLDQEETRAGMARMMLDAAERVGEALARPPSARQSPRDPHRY